MLYKSLKKVYKLGIFKQFLFMTEQQAVRQPKRPETRQATLGEQCEPVPLNNGSPEELLPPNGVRPSIGIFRDAILRLREKITRYFIRMLTTNPALRQITAVIAAQVIISLVFETLLLDKKNIEKDFNQFFNKLATGMRHSLPKWVKLKSEIVTDFPEIPESEPESEPESTPRGTLVVFCKIAKGRDNNHYDIGIYYYSGNKCKLICKIFKNSPGKSLNRNLDQAVNKIKNRFRQNSNNGNDDNNRNNRGDDNNRNNRGDDNNRNNRGDGNNRKKKKKIEKIGE